MCLDKAVLAQGGGVPNICAARTPWVHRGKSALYGTRDNPSESRFRAVQFPDDPTNDCGSRPAAQRGPADAPEDVVGNRHPDGPVAPWPPTAMVNGSTSVFALPRAPRNLLPCSWAAGGAIVKFGAPFVFRGASGVPTRG